MRTIRQQLLVQLLAGALLCTMLAGVGIYGKVLEESNELFDYQLRQVAGSVPVDLPSGQEERARGDPEEDVTVQVWKNSGELTYRSSRSVLLPAAARTGYGTVSRGPDEWRVYVLERRGYRVQVAQNEADRRHLAVRLAARSLAPFLAFLPVLAILIYIVVGRSLRPLQRLAQAVSTRSERSLEPLALGEQSPELAPVVAALNGLLGQLDAALKQQRAFVADAAHELRSPLTALSLQLQLAERAPDNEQRRMAFAKLRERLDRSTHLVRQLLTAARHESAAHSSLSETTDLVAIAQDCVADRFMVADAKGVDLGVSGSEASVAVLGDAAALRIMLGNLVDNAVRYTPAGGRVDVAVNSANRLAGPLLQITDSGPGIPPKERERVFDRFYRTEGQAQWGSGLGLSIVRDIATAHGAKVMLDDGPDGLGLSVRVQFPPLEKMHANLTVTQPCRTNLR